MATKPKQEPVPVKAGWKTTEFALSTAAALLGIAIAGGFVDPEGITTADRIAGIICSALAALGYSIGRSNVKAAASEDSK